MTGPEQHGGITARLVGDDVVNRALRRLAQQIGDPKPVMDAAARLLEESARRRITTTNRAPDGEAWKPSLRALRVGGKTLEDKGHLRDSITSKATASTAEIGSARRYARIHQLGGDIERRAGVLSFNKSRSRFAKRSAARRRKRGAINVAFHGAYTIHMPARPYLGIDDDDRRDIQDMVTNALRRAVQA